MRQYVERFVRRIEDTPDIKDSLKVKTRPGEKIMRQVDLRLTPDQPVLLKLFICWNWDADLWHVFVEGPNEDFVEKGEPNW